MHIHSPYLTRIVMVGMFGASTALGAGPKLTEVGRFQSPTPLPQDGLLIWEPPDNPLVLAATEERGKTKVTAHRSQKKALKQVTLPAKGPLPQRDAHFEGGQLVLFAHSADAAFWANLTTGKVKKLPHFGHATSLHDRIQFRGRTLVALTGNEPGPTPHNPLPTKIRVVDLESGAILAEHQLAHDLGYYSMLVRFGVDRHGKLQLLVSGDFVFGVLDVETKKYRELLPAEAHGGYRASEFPARIGRFVQFRGTKGFQLFDVQELLDGKLTPVRDDPWPTKPIGDGASATLAASHSDDGFFIWELASGKPLGPKLRGLRTDGLADRPYVGDFVEAEGKHIALVVDLLHPSTYLPGTIFSYVDVRTGTVLRRRTSDESLLHQLLVGPAGAVFGVERARWGEKGYVVVDVRANKVVAESDSIELIAPAFLSATGALMGVRADPTDRVCVFALADPAKESCIEDPLQRYARYDSRPIEARGDRLVISLVGPKKEGRSDWFGFVEHRVE